MPYAVHLGKYGVYKDKLGDPYILTIGCGSDMYNRQNALAVTTSGNVIIDKLQYKNVLYIKESSKILSVYWVGIQAP